LEFNRGALPRCEDRADNRVRQRLHLDGRLLPKRTAVHPGAVRSTPNSRWSPRSLNRHCWASCRRSVTTWARTGRAGHWGFTAGSGNEAAATGARAGSGHRRISGADCEPGGRWLLHCL